MDGLVSVYPSTLVAEAETGQEKEKAKARKQTNGNE